MSAKTVAKAEASKVEKLYKKACQNHSASQQKLKAGVDTKIAKFQEKLSKAQLSISKAQKEVDAECSRITKHQQALTKLKKARKK